MFLAFIAVALELAALALGAKLILGCCKEICRRKHLCGATLDTYAYKDDKGESRTSYIEAEHAHKDKDGHHKHHCFGFLKFIGYFTVILSFLALIGTLISFGTYMKDVNDLEMNRDAPAEQYRYNRELLQKYNGNFSHNIRVISPTANVH